MKSNISENDLKNISGGLNEDGRFPSPEIDDENGNPRTERKLGGVCGYNEERMPTDGTSRPGKYGPVPVGNNPLAESELGLVCGGGEINIPRERTSRPGKYGTPAASGVGEDISIPWSGDGRNGPNNA